MQQLLFVFIGGGLGSLCRHALSRWIAQVSFPYATFTANVLSCLVLGLVLGLSMKNTIGVDARVLLITGFCGGFSTFSTFSAEIYKLITNNQWLMVFIYIMASLMFCVFSIFIGIKLFHN